MSVRDLDRERRRAVFRARLSEAMTGVPVIMQEPPAEVRDADPDDVQPDDRMSPATVRAAHAGARRRPEPDPK